MVLQHVGTLVGDVSDELNILARSRTCCCMPDNNESNNPRAIFRGALAASSDTRV